MIHCLFHLRRTKDLFIFTLRFHSIQRRVNKNIVGIQMLEDGVREKLFGSLHTIENPLNKDQILSNLRQHNISIKRSQRVDYPKVSLPPIKNNVSEHIQLIAAKQISPYFGLLNKASNDLIVKRLPSKWSFEPGWTFYPTNSEPIRVDAPKDPLIFFDVEVLQSTPHTPTLATAFTQAGWYSWCAESLTNEENGDNESSSIDALIPLSSADSDESARLVLGHHVAYDRSYIKDEYAIEMSSLRFLDTLSMHVAISGLTSSQKVLQNTSVSARVSPHSPVYRYEKEQTKRRHLGPPSELWKDVGSLNNLEAVYKLHCGQHKSLDKSLRDIFIKGSIEDVLDNFQLLMTYCAQDVQATFEIFQAMWPIFKKRFPHPATLAGMIQLGSVFLPVNSNWKRYISSSDKAYEDCHKEIKDLFSSLAKEALNKLYYDRYKDDLWLWDLDWKMAKNLNSKNSNDAFLPAYPKWYRDAMMSKGSRESEINRSKNNVDSNSKQDTFNDQESSAVDVGTGQRIAAKLLRLTWRGFPLQYSIKQGWGYVVPGNSSNFAFVESFKHRATCSTSNPEDIEGEKEILFEYPYRTLIEKFGSDDHGPSSQDNAPSHKGIGPCDDVIIPGAWFFKLPHKDGNHLRVGNPLAAQFESSIKDGLLDSFQTKSENISGESSSNFSLSHLLDLTTMASYWRNNMKRIKSEMVVPFSATEQKKLETTSKSDTSGPSTDWYGAILPRVISSGTVTRRAVEQTWLTASNAYEDRIGSELKAMVQAPPGYHIVGADVDSEELWIAALLGDSSSGVHGGTPFGWLTLQGSKKDSSDLHSRTAKVVGVTRHQAKILNYARIYGCGRPYTELLLKRFNPSLSGEEIKQKVTDLMRTTKGFRKMIFQQNAGKISRKLTWRGGSESDMFNQLERIANWLEPKTPVLHASMSRALEPKTVNFQFAPSRINWVVQSSAVDYLHVMLVCMSWLCEEYQIRARLMISIHDEIRYLVRSEDRYRAALALHISNLLTRSLFAYSVGIYDLPQSVAYFSCVDIDRCMRKEVNLTCRTPSNPKGIEQGYGISDGEALDIYQISALTGDLLKQ